MFSRNPSEKKKAATSVRGCVFIGALVVLVPNAAHAVDVSFKLEPGVAIPLTAPQSDVYGVGLGQSFKALIGVTDFLDVGPAASFTLVPAKNELAPAGQAIAFGAGARLKVPHDSKDFFGISPWLDADAFYVRTGVLDRPGFDIAAGFSIPIGEARTFWVGPFVRYNHIVQIDRPGFDNHDAKILLAGISFEVGTGVERAAPPPAPPAPPAEPRIVEREVIKEVCADLDVDGVPDTVDRCPEVVGLADTWGCPAYEKVIVKKDKLELKEKLYFAYDEAKLEAASFPVLDEVVRALQDNKGFRVQVEGHTDSTGDDRRNQTLSEQRAAAVLDYLVAHGVAKERLVSKGFSSSVPVDTNATEGGRENNRRVEFVVSFIILKSESAK